MKILLKDTKIGQKIKIELKSLETENIEANIKLELLVNHKLGLKKYEGKLIDVQGNRFALKNGDTVIFFNTDLYDIYDIIDETKNINEFDFKESEKK